MRPCYRFLRSFKRFKRAQNGALFIDWLMEIYSHVVMAVTGGRKRRNGGVVFDFIKKVRVMPVFEFALDFTESSIFDCYDYND